MTKPSGVLEYAIANLLSGNASLFACLAFDDVHGNRFGSQIPSDAAIEAYVVADITTGPYSVRVSKILTAGPDGKLTGLDVNVLNGGPGDITTGILYVRVNHAENLAL